MCSSNIRRNAIHYLLFHGLEKSVRVETNDVITFVDVGEMAICNWKMHMHYVIHKYFSAHKNSLRVGLFQNLFSVDIAGTSGLYFTMFSRTCVLCRLGDLLSRSIQNILTVL